MSGRFWTMRLMLRKATYCTSGSDDSSVTSGGASFLLRLATKSASGDIISINFISTAPAQQQ